MMEDEKCPETQYPWILHIAGAPSVLTPVSHFQSTSWLTKSDAIQLRNLSSVVCVYRDKQNKKLLGTFPYLKYTCS